MGRKYFSIIALAAAIALAGCNKDIAPVSPAQEDTYEFTLEATADIQGVRTSYEDEMYFSWNSGDKISVLFHSGSTDKFFTLTAQNSGASATFKGSVTTGYTLGAADGNKYALYPANDSHSYTSGESKPVTFFQPSEVDFTADGFSANIPLAALGDENNTFVFKPMCSVVKFSFHNIPGTTKKVRFKVADTHGYALSGTFPCSVGGYYLFWSAWGSAPITFIEDVNKGKVEFYVPVCGWGVPNFKPEILLTDAESDAILYSATAKNSFPAETDGLGSIVVIPSIKITNVVEWSFPSAYGIDWESEPTEAAGDSGEGFDAVVRMKAKADADKLYVYLEVKKDALYDISEYDYSNCSQLFIGSGSAEEGQSSWIWNAFYETKIEAWMKLNNNAHYYHWNGNVTRPVATEHNGLYYYEIAITRSAFPALSGSSAILGFYVTGLWVKDNVWQGSGDAIGSAPARWQDPLTIALP